MVLGGVGGCGGSDSQAAVCSTTAALPAVKYDITKSRFAFGGKPVMTVQPDGSVLWTGPDGVLSIAPYGFSSASLDSGALESSLSPATTDYATEVAYARDYYVAMGVRACEVVAGPNIYSVLQRAVAGVLVAESIANATFDVDNQTTREDFYWPEVPASVVAGAVAFQQQLADPAALAAYKAKLPADAQGQGQVVIHHSDPAAAAFSPFQALFTYDVHTSGDAGDGNANLSFSVAGTPVVIPWS
jgi:hypothetical protein